MAGGELGVEGPGGGDCHGVVQASAAGGGVPAAEAVAGLHRGLTGSGGRAPGDDGGGDAALAVHRASVGPGVPGHGDGHAVGAHVTPAVPVAVAVAAVVVGAVAAVRAALSPAVLGAGVRDPGAVREAVALPGPCIQLTVTDRAVGGHGVLAGVVLLIPRGFHMILILILVFPAPGAGLGPAVERFGVILPLAVGVGAVGDAGIHQVAAVPAILIPVTVIPGGVSIGVVAGAATTASTAAVIVAILVVIGAAAVLVPAVIPGVVNDAVGGASPAVTAAAGDGGGQGDPVHVHDGRLPVILRPGVGQQTLVDTGGGQGQDGVRVELVYLEGPWGDSQGIVLAVVQQDRVQTVTPGEGVRPDDRGGVGDLGGDQVDTVGKPVGQVGDGDRPHVLKPDLLDILPDLRPGLVVLAGEGLHGAGAANGQDTVPKGPGQVGLADGPGGVRLSG